MPRVCFYTGKKTTFGNQITHRGKAKYLGGVGTKITGITARKFRPNIQKVRAVINGRVCRIKVSAKAIKMGLITKPVRRTWKKPETAAAASAKLNRLVRFISRPKKCAESLWASSNTTAEYSGRMLPKSSCFRAKSAKNRW